MAAGGVGGVIAIVASMATVASATVEVVSRRREEPLSSDVRWAVHSWWPVITVGSLLVLGGPLIGVAIMIALSVQLSREYHRMVLGDTAPWLGWFALAIIPVHYGLIALFPASPTPFLTFGCLLFGVPMLRMLSAGTADFVRVVAAAQWGMMLSTVAAGHFAWLLLADLPGMRGNYFLAFVLLLTFCGDAMQWVFGRLFGRTLLVPHLSPKKTVEGLVGGMCMVTLIAALGGPLVMDLDWWICAALGFIAVPVGLLGDLVVSSIKRDVGTKDTGAVLPGQGGLLDRLDAALFTVPVATQLLVAWLRGLPA